MRVSELMRYNLIGNRLRQQSIALLKAQERVTTGKKINRASDDPIGHGQIINFNNSLGMSDQYLRNIGRAEAFMSTTETALVSIQDQLSRAHELSIQMANASLSPENRANAAKEVAQIYDQLVALANTKHDGQYIFSGDKISTKSVVNRGATVGTAIPPPATITTGVNDVLSITLDSLSANVTLPSGSYSGDQLATALETAINGEPVFQNGGASVSVRFETDHLVITSKGVGANSEVSITGGSSQPTLGLAAGTQQIVGNYLGDTGESAVSIGTNTSIIKNLPGGRVFKGVGGGIDLFSAIGGLQQALEQNDLSGIQASINALGNAKNQVTDERSLIGARMNRTENSASILEDFKLTISKLKSDREDVDLSSAISDLVLQQTALETTRAVSARIIQQSLLDFLR